jgi:hypothetical protein
MSVITLPLTPKDTSGVPSTLKRAMTKSVVFSLIPKNLPATTILPSR